MEEDHVLPDFRDIESKLGRKVPEILIQSLMEGFQKTKEERKPPDPVKQGNSGDLKRLESKMLLLKQEMAHLRAIDGKLMQQLLTINEGIESIRWAMEEKAVLASHDGSQFSLCSLSESPDASPHGSYSSLLDTSDGLDTISVGSYLDTLAEDTPDHASPSDLEFLSDGGTGEVGLKDRALRRELRVDGDEYYCFG
ncbi:leucine rich adaptor protein 1-like [Brienomyrus brachyistius]|uniref:leucine rich adaptor protein 1-like n=1 Tax=Brienomyrus brachyistius TaxID=42636 RepID=UPI0020B1B8D0|nr:leucine rich adaptor protein 1-like [Brienomyrus brachyistius]